jgi:hypothetical protein
MWIFFYMASHDVFFSIEGILIVIKSFFNHFSVMLLFPEMFILDRKNIYI